MEDKKKGSVFTAQNVILFMCTGAFILLPGKKFLLMDGAPLDSLFEILSVVALSIVVFILPFKRIERKLLGRYVVIFVCLAIAKVSIGLIAPTNGLYARYFANPSWEGKYERSTEFISLKKATRIDGNINFRNVGYPYVFINAKDPIRVDGKINFSNFGPSFSGMPFPLYFFNDTKRFNYYGESAHLRIDPPFSVEWSGYLFIPESKEYSFDIDTMDKVWMWLDGDEVYSGKGGLKRMDLSKGSHKIEIRFSHSTKGIKELVVRASLGSDHPSVIPSRFFYLEPVSTTIHKKNSLLIYLHYVLVAFWILLTLFIATVHRERLTLALLKQERIFLSLIFLVLLVGRLMAILVTCRDPQSMILAGGNDWLGYEAAARSILLGDFLNAAFTDGNPFYYTPLYRYFLAAAHLLTGESPFFATVLQGSILFAIVAIMTYYLGKRLFSKSVGVGAMALFVSIPRARVLFVYFLGEPLATFLSMASFLLILNFSEHKKYWRLPLSGLLFGLATGIRPNLLPFTLPVFIWLYYTSGSLKSSFRKGVLFLIPVVIIIVLIAVRNYVVSGKPVLFNTNASVALLMGNPVPAGIGIKKVHRPFLDVLSIAPQTRQVLEFMLQAPGAFFNGILRKFLYCFGVDYPSLSILETGVFLPSVLAAIGAILSLTRLGRLLLVVRALALFRVAVATQKSAKALTTNSNLPSRALMTVDAKLRPHRVLGIIFILFNIMVVALTLANSYGWRYVLPSLPFIYVFASYSLSLGAPCFISIYRKLAEQASRARVAVTLLIEKSFC